MKRLRPWIMLVLFCAAAGWLAYQIAAPNPNPDSASYKVNRFFEDIHRTAIAEEKQAQ